MNVWLNVGGGQGYDFVINRSRGENRANVERLTGESAQTVGEAAYAGQRQDHTVYPSQIAFGRYYFAATQGDG